jgi:NAD(P)-dependent dehydrogenase (short-subunit alcohol dehydrogenase family)
LSGGTALITGGGSGLGRAIAREYAACGASQTTGATRDRDRRRLHVRRGSLPLRRRWGDDRRLSRQYLVLFVSGRSDAPDTSSDRSSVWIPCHVCVVRFSAHRWYVWVE